MKYVTCITQELDKCLQNIGFIIFVIITAPHRQYLLMHNKCPQDDLAVYGPVPWSGVSEHEPSMPDWQVGLDLGGWLAEGLGSLCEHLHQAILASL